jgi:hypothetical protein
MLCGLQKIDREEVDGYLSSRTCDGEGGQPIVRGLEATKEDAESLSAS